MAKLPRIDDAPERPQQQQERPPERRDPAIFEGYLPRRVDVKMPRRHALILRDKLRQLQDSGARLMDGTMVSDRTKAVLWILENLVDTSTSRR